jgi:hypothetical protein
VRSICGLEVGRGLLAGAPVRLDLIGDPLALHEAAQNRKRNRIERLANRLKQSRRVAAGSDKRADCYGAFVILAAIRMWL